MLNSMESCARKQKRFFEDLVWSEAVHMPQPLLEAQLDPVKHYIRVHTECFSDPRDGVAPSKDTVYLDPGRVELDQWRNATLYCRNPRRNTAGLPVTHKFAVVQGHDRVCTTWARWVSFNRETRSWEKSEH